MFEFLKLENKRKELELLKDNIIKEKKELEIIKEILDEKTNKIDISDFYVFKYGNLSYLVTFETDDNIHYLVRDVFNKQILFKILKAEIKYNNIIYMGLNDKYNGEDYYAFLTPILEENHDLLLYSDRLVPEYVLRQFLCKLNKIDVSNYVKKKAK